MNTSYSKQPQKGFTLIELLVVIAIIGVLASVVMPSANSARDKAVDAYVISNMSSLSSEAEIVLDSDGNYDGVCDNARIQTFLSKAAERSTGNPAAYECVDDVGDWAAAVPFRVQNQVNGTSGTDYWCSAKASEAVLIDATTTLAAGTPSC